MAVLVSANAAKTKKIGEIVVRRIIQKDPPRPLILALQGELGSGKTTFVQGVSRAVGIKGNRQSPTFVLARWHDLPKKLLPFRHLIHIDLYRLERASEARRLGLAKIFKDRDAIVLCEWADKFKTLIPRSAVWVSFRHGTGNTREIKTKIRIRGLSRL